MHFAKTGTFQLTESPKGTSHTMRVIAGDNVDYENGVTESSSSGGKKLPSLEIGAVLLGITAAAMLVRRKA